VPNVQTVESLISQQGAAREPARLVVRFPSSPLTTRQQQIALHMPKSTRNGVVFQWPDAFPRPLFRNAYFTHMFAMGWVDASPIVITTFTFPGFVAVGTIAFTWNTPEFNPGAAPA
jgi:hypothetical protein